MHSSTGHWVLLQAMFDQEIIALNIHFISHYKNDVVVITQDRGRAEVKCNNNDIIRVTGYSWLLSHIRYCMVANFHGFKFLWILCSLLIREKLQNLAI